MRGTEETVFLLRNAQIQERRRHGGGLGGGGLPTELEAMVASSWAATAACSMVAVLDLGGVRGGAARDLRSLWCGAHVPQLPLYACEGQPAGDSLRPCLFMFLLLTF
jgi:hypothetical protein